VILSGFVLGLHASGGDTLLLRCNMALLSQRIPWSRKQNPDFP
jgi:hypothetical protein